MGLDDLNPEEKDNESGTRRYVTISRKEFEEFLDSTDHEWEKIGGKYEEYVYSFVSMVNIPDVEVRIFSTIDKYTEESRSKGKDAIRLVIWHTPNHEPVGGEKKTLRIETWRKNLREKIEHIAGNHQQYIRECEKCGSILVKRKGKHGDFFGCTNYPDCGYTEN